MLKTTLTSFALMQFSFWFFGWLLIILLNPIFEKTNDNIDEREFIKSEILKDANNLFKTGLIYNILLCISWSFTIQFVRWAIAILLLILTILPCLSSLLMLLDFNTTKYKKFQCFAAILSQFLPLVMCIVTMYNIYNVIV